ncbi:MAG TPA: hypothetical protein EYM81_01455 [Candidatus Poseidoniales archaeon]|nr:hypothetical protein [Candidatus Poseidoniales archaeon]HIN44435.1 hypothetical protein [Candidatus Poseidoniales archaeon]
MSVRIILPSLIILLLAPMASAQSIGEALQECPGTITGSTEPSQIHLQLTDTPSEVVVMWATARRGNAVVEWNGQSADGDSYCYNHDMAFHMATMTDLTPGEEVTYRVGDGNDWSQEYKFTPIDIDANRFEWIAIADYGDSSEALDVSEAIIADTTAQMVTISGDISYADGEQSSWDDWFDNQEASMTRIPWVTAVGNHENEPGYEFTPYAHRFDADEVKETEPFWYSRDFPGVHMVFMSTEHDYNLGSVQYAALEADLSAANANREQRPFIVVIAHKPMYSSNDYHGSEIALREAVEELYQNHGVDLVIAGHDHFYERTWPVFQEEPQSFGGEDGTLFGQGLGPIHIVAGNAGRTPYTGMDEPQPAWSAYREVDTFGYMKIIYDEGTRSLSFTFHRTDETIGDQFTIQEGVLNEEGDEKFQFIPGFGTLLPLICLIYAAFSRYDADYLE